MRCCSQVRCVDDHRRSKEGLHQLNGLFDCSCAGLPGKGILQQVDERGRLLPLEEVHNPDQIVEEAEARIHGTPLSASPADTLALPAAAQWIDRPVKFYQTF